MRRKTNDQFKQEVYDLVGEEYIILSEYKNTKTKVKIRHNKCGNTYEVIPSNFLGGSRCPKCSQKQRTQKLSKTNKRFKQEVYNLVGYSYTVLDSYVNSYTKLKVKHNKCGNIYEVTPNSFLKGHGCPYCVGLVKKTDEQFKQEVYNLVGDKYTILEPYVGARNKIMIKHNRCGNSYVVRPYNFLFGKRRCPYCNSPKGETVITKLLDTLNINYEYQKTFPDLKYKSYLSYDFYIPNQSILIEYQGIQHYQPVDYFGGDDWFTIQQKHDQMKLDYAKEHGYNLIAVPYTEDTLYKIKKYLRKHGLADENTSVDIDTLHRLFDENKEVMDWLKDK